MTEERRPGIRTVNDGTPHIRPFVYPEPIVPIISESALAATESWVSRTQAGYIELWYYRNDAQSKRLFLTWLNTFTERQKAQIEQFFATVANRPISVLTAGSWQLQRNEGGMLTCQLASAANALNFLYPNNPNPYTETDILNALGGVQFAAANPNGVEARDIEQALQRLAQHIRVRRTNSVVEILQAAENGAAVMFPISRDHEALIPPGHRLTRDTFGNVCIQVADPMSREPRVVPVERLIKSEISVVRDPQILENNVLILEKGIITVQPRPSGIRSVQPTPSRIRTVPPETASRIRIVKPNSIRTVPPSIRTIDPQ